jgi:multidrug resistance efflux pump
VATKLAVKACEAVKAGFVLVNIEPFTYEAVATKLAVKACEALKARLAFVNTEPFTYEAVVTKLAVEANDELKTYEADRAYDALNAGLVLVNIDPVT